MTAALIDVLLDNGRPRPETRDESVERPYLVSDTDRCKATAFDDHLILLPGLFERLRHDQYEADDALFLPIGKMVQKFV
jgi:hypothetical protein